MTATPTRKLAAILAADVVGYSRLIAEDEARTLDALRALRRELFEPLVAEHRGEVVKRMGDGWLIAFGSVVDAAQCAIQVQERLAGHDRIKLRVGVHLGDIVHEDEDIYGDGVNIAARLQEVAEPGGVLISGTAYESVIGRLDEKFGDTGEQTLKNIARPIRAWRWQASRMAPDGLATPFQNDELPDVERTRPSLAVLPFTNLSSDPEQEFFADGMTEDVINSLSKFRWLFVIARGTMFTFKERRASTSQVADDLGVRYVVEGSIRKAGNRVRVSVQLIDTATGTNFWSERYDRDLDDIFDVQDEVTMAIVTAIEPTLSSAERTRARRKAPENLDAWELYQRGLWHKYRFTADDNRQAISFFQQAIARDPSFALSYAELAHVCYISVLLGFVSGSSGVIQTGHDSIQKALELDPADAIVLDVAGRGAWTSRDYVKSISFYRQSISANPNYGAAYFGLAQALLYSGRPDESINLIDIGVSRSPRDPTSWAFLGTKALAYLVMAEFDEALNWARQATAYSNATVRPHMIETMALAHLGRTPEAEAALKGTYSKMPEFNMAFVKSIADMMQPQHGKVLVEGMRLLGQDGG